MHNFTTVWFKGASNKAPDALSCYPTWEPCTTELLAECDEGCMPEMTIADIRALNDGAVGTKKASGYKS